MNEVEKMYENAEPNRDCNLYKHFTECPMKHTQCEDCENFVYPLFTATKQLELIKWLVHYIKQINITDAISGEFYFTAFGYVSYMKVDFDEALASFINTLWQDLTEEERKQIKNILE